MSQFRNSRYNRITICTNKQKLQQILTRSFLKETGKLKHPHFYPQKIVHQMHIIFR